MSGGETYSMNPLDITKAAQASPMDPFDITKAAQSYSNIAVVLAGFSFVILMYVVQSSGGNSPEDSPDDAEKGLALIALTFLGNIALSFLWGMVSGDQYQRMRPEMLGLVATLLFANTAPLTFQAVAFFVAATGRSHLLRLFRWCYLFTVMMAAVFVIVNVVIIHTEIHNFVTNAHDLPLWALTHSPYAKSLVVFVLIVLLLAWLVNNCSNRTSAAASKVNRVQGTFRLFTFAWLANGVIFVIVFACISTQSPNFRLPINLLYVFAVFWLLLAGWAMVFTPGVTRVTLTGN
jgi:hypothetical protein